MKNKSQHLHYLKTDFRGEIVFAYRYFRLKVLNKLWTFYYRCKLKLMGIPYGKGCTFLGVSIFNRFPESKIIIGDNCRFLSSSINNFRGINHKCIVQTGKPDAKIMIGNNCGFSGVSIVCDQEISIGNDVMVGANVSIGDRDDHEEEFNVVSKPIKIGNHVWIGMNATILKGVTIGDYCVVGAESVVAKNMPSGEIWGGQSGEIYKAK